MKFAILLSVLSAAAGFAPQSQPRQMSKLFMSDDLKTGTVKWYVKLLRHSFLYTSVTYVALKSPLISMITFYLFVAFFVLLLSHIRFDTAKGYGFIVPDNGDKDVFVHQTAINVSGFRSLAEGEAVEFKLVEENGKTKAIDVTGPDGADVKGAPFNPQSDEYEW